jgi:dihydrofolate reductase
MLAINVSAFVANSVDGFIARKDGNIDWLNSANKQISDSEHFGYANFMQSTDIIVLGEILLRRYYLLINGHLKKTGNST